VDEIKETLQICLIRGFCDIMEWGLVLLENDVIEILFLLLPSQKRFTY